MSEHAGVGIRIDELVLDGVDPAAVPGLLRAIEQAIASAPVTDAHGITAIVSAALHEALGGSP